MGVVELWSPWVSLYASPNTSVDACKIFCPLRGTNGKSKPFRWNPEVRSLRKKVWESFKLARIFSLLEWIQRGFIKTLLAKFLQVSRKHKWVRKTKESFVERKHDEKTYKIRYWKCYLTPTFQRSPQSWVHSWWKPQS